MQGDGETGAACGAGRAGHGENGCGYVCLCIAYVETYVYVICMQTHTHTHAHAHALSHTGHEGNGHRVQGDRGARASLCMMRVLLNLMKMAKFKRLQTCTEIEVLQHDLAAKNGFAALPDAFCRKYLK